MGSLDYPFNPVSLALGAEATFVGRALDSDRKGLTEVLRGAAAAPRRRAGRDHAGLPDLQRRLVRRAAQGRRRGAADQRHATVSRSRSAPTASTAWSSPASDSRSPRPPMSRPTRSSCTTLTLDDPAYAFALSRLSEQNLEHMVMGIFRQVSKPTYDDAARAQQVARRARPSRTTRRRCSRCFAARTPGPSTNRANLDGVTSPCRWPQSCWPVGHPAGWAATRPPWPLRQPDGRRRSSSAWCRP